MEWTGLNELREKYLSFFESKGHLRLPSFSLVPQNDRSLLLINAGMSPMKKYFTGEITPPRERVTTCQKCIRTPDIERVGKTARHGTYFEMLGNFSFGDYFKREAIGWAYEFCTEVMQMDLDRIYVSVYLDDDEAYDIWTKEMGIAPDHMVRFGKEDNFWEHGAGPCGPCSELYYDRGEEFGCGKPDCKVGCECDRYVEFWNLVFTQFSNDGQGNYTPLAHPNIDTGMGLERLACIAQGVDNLFEVDTIQNIMKHVCRVANVAYHADKKKDVSLRVITDHIRSTTFMIGDGVMPSNEGRGYVLRRLLRRAARHGRLLGIDRPFLAEVCETVIQENKNAYPELTAKHDFIVKVIAQEEENFLRTIDTGLSLLEDMMKNCGDTLSGADAFKLSDTYGFPIDLTEEILAEKNIAVDMDEYHRLVQEQRVRARGARKDAGAEGWKDTGVVTKGLPKTDFVGYDTMQAEAEVICVLVDGERVEFAESGKPAALVLNATPFYGESGGQVGDVGTITGDGWRFDVTNTTKTNDGVFLQFGELTEGESLKVGDKAACAVAVETRKAIMRNHTAAHLLQAALRQHLGSHVEQAGQLVSAKSMRFDFSHFSALTAEELSEVEKQINDVILADLPVTSTEMGLEEAKAMGAMALFGEKYADRVRVVKAGDFSLELCGGTHVDSTGKLGLFKIISESSVAGGVRRIEAVTGTGVLDYMAGLNRLIADTAAAMKLGNVHELAQKAAAMTAELKEKEKEIAALSAQLTELKSADLFADAKAVGAVRLVTAAVENMSADELRALGDKAKEAGDDLVLVLTCVNNGKGNIAVAAGKAAVAAGANAGKLAKAVAQLAGGNGGGKPDFAMAGAKEIAKLPEALAAAEGLLADMLK